MTFSFMVHWIWICTVLPGQDTNHKKEKKKNQNKKTHKKKQTKWCQEEVEGGKKDYLQN